MKELQALAVRSELRFEVSKQTALVFLIKRTPEDLHSLAESISQRHGIVSKQQAHRLDVAYSSFAAAAAAAGGGAVSAVGGLQNGARDAACHDGSRETSSKVEVCWPQQLHPSQPLPPTPPVLFGPCCLSKFPQNSGGCPQSLNNSPLPPPPAQSLVQTLLSFQIPKKLRGLTLNPGHQPPPPPPPDPPLPLSPWSPPQQQDIWTLLFSQNPRKPSGLTLNNSPPPPPTSPPQQQDIHTLLSCVGPQKCHGAAPNAKHPQPQQQTLLVLVLLLTCYAMDRSYIKDWHPDIKFVPF